ncbi:MAG: NAD(P)H-binding protein [Polyangia bacterium]
MVVFGATGGTGKSLIERALAAGHDVVAVARQPQAVAAHHERLVVVKGDVLVLETVRAAVRGSDVVISAIGPANNKRPGTLVSDGVANIIAACTAEGVKRFVFESGIMVGDGRGLSVMMRIGLAMFRWRNRALCADKRIAEAAIRASALDWVIVRPATLVHEPARGGYRFGTDIDLNLRKTLPHADVAEFLVRVAGDATMKSEVIDIGF